MLTEVPAKRVPLRFVLAVFVGNGLAFYDFVTFSYFSVYIGRTFFPSHDPTASLLASLATFWLGFLTRPIGAVVLGSMGDRKGRKPAMLLTFLLLGISIAGIALTPSYAAIGTAAPVLVIAFRLLQGFALGGEVGPTTAYMAESVPPARRGLYISMQYATQDCAGLLAGLVGVGLAWVLSDAELGQWGWRAALLIGASIVPFGLWLRSHLPETLEPAAPRARRNFGERWSGFAAQVRPLSTIIVLGVLMLTAGTIGSYTLGYLTTYALSTLKLSAAVAFGFTVINSAFSILTEVSSGWLADRFGRKPVMIVPGVLLLVSIFPFFWVMGHVHNTWVLYGAEAVVVMFAGLSSVPAIVAITELVPAAVRSGAVAMIYAAAISVFGGSTQFVITKLIAVTGDPYAPAWYWSGAMAIGLVAMALTPESAPGKTGEK
jgi:MFS family permease